MEYTAEYLERLKIELDRCCGEGYYNTYTDDTGNKFIGGGESHVKKHLTSSRDYVSGRQFRFPGIANGWEFESAIRAAGYRLTKARNYRNQSVYVVTKNTKA